MAENAAEQTEQNRAAENREDQAHGGGAKDLNKDNSQK